ncbi:MAG: amidohydrolase family protein [Gaiellaceae bacterium]
MEAIERAQQLLRRYEEELSSLIPEGCAVFDAHVHLGTDIDGFVGILDELVSIMDRFGIAKAFMFCLDEPDRHPAFRAGNDRTLDFAARSEGRLIPFVRLDLTEGPIEEAERCLDLGARGIKLHPRAQGFMLTDERLDPVFALSAERKVPILIHGGRGLPPIAGDLARLVERHDDAQLIIAHAGIADLAALARSFAGKAGVFFDTSTWSPVDLLDFYRLISPEQVVYASDYPYGRQPNSLHIALRTALVAGFDERQIRNMLWDNAARIAAGDPPLEPTAPQGSDVYAQPLQLARIHQYLSMATPLLWTRQPDTIGVLGLALNTCGEPNGAGADDALERIRELLETARDLWRQLPEIEEAERFLVGRMTFSLVHLADIVAVTTTA